MSRKAGKGAIWNTISCFYAAPKCTTEQVYIPSAKIQEHPNTHEEHKDSTISYGNDKTSLNKKKKKGIKQSKIF